MRKPHETSIELRQKRASLIEKAGALLLANPRMSPTEQVEFDRLHAEADGLNLEILQAEQEAREQSLGETLPSLLHDLPAGGTARGTAAPVEGYRDLILGADESFEARVRASARESGGDLAETRFDAMVRAAAGCRVPDLREAERRALGAGAGALGGFMVPSLTSARVLDRLLNRTVVRTAGALAGTLRLDAGDELVPKHATGPTAAWVGENQQLGDSDLTFSAQTLKKHILASGVIKMPLRLLDSTPVNLERDVARRASAAMAVELDRAALFGLGTALEPLGLANHPGLSVHSMGANGAAITSYDPFIDAQRLIEDGNGNPVTAAVMAPRTSATLEKFKDQNDQPLQRPPKMEDLPFLVSNQIRINETHGSATNASRVLQGHWPDMILFLSSVFVLPLRERYADSLQFGLVLYTYADVLVAYPESFASISGIIP